MSTLSVSSRGIRARIDMPCSNEPELFGTHTWACRRLATGEAGNAIFFFVHDSDKTLVISSVNAEICKPKPEGCRCKNLLGSLIDKYPDLDKISGKFMARNAIGGCKCYLGAAGRKGFNYISLDSNKDGCKGKKALTSLNYDEICKQYAENECGSDKTPVDGYITKV